MSEEKTYYTPADWHEEWRKVYDLCLQLGAPDMGGTQIERVIGFILELHHDAMKYQWLTAILRGIMEDPDSLIPRDDKGRIYPKAFAEQLNRFMKQEEE